MLAPCGDAAHLEKSRGSALASGRRKVSSCLARLLEQSRPYQPRGSHVSWGQQGLKDTLIRDTDPIRRHLSPRRKVRGPTPTHTVDGLHAVVTSEREREREGRHSRHQLPPAFAFMALATISTRRGISSAISLQIFASSSMPSTVRVSKYVTRYLYPSSDAVRPSTL